MKRKILVGAAIFFGIIIIAAASVTVWQWRNIKALYIAVTTDETVIDEKLRESDEKFADDVKDYLKDNIRDFTEEELQQIESGEKSKTEILAKIISESVSEEGYGGNSENQNVSGSGSGTSGQNSSGSGSSGQNSSGSGSSGQNSSNGASSGNAQNPQPSQSVATAEQIVARRVANLYSYQSEFEARISELAGSVTAYMHSYKAANPGITWHDAKVATVQRFMSSATSIESECYAKVDNEVAQLRSELKAVGADTSIADTVAASAENQMELKKSKIMSQYMSKMD